MNVSQLAQIVVNGLLLGGTLALVAVGFALVWGIMNIVNLAHGAYIMLGAYTTYWLYRGFALPGTALRVGGIDPFLSIPISMALLFILGYVVQKYLINLVIRAPLLATFLLTFGLEVVIVNVALIWWTGDFRGVTTAYSGSSLDLGGVTITYIRVAALAISLVLAAGLHLFLSRTKLGNAIRATGMDIDAARLTGVNIARIYAVTYAIGAAFAGAAGSLLALIFPITPTMGSTFTLTAFVISVLGGLGTVAGVVVGGLVFGLVQVLTGISFSGLQDAIPFVMLVLVLIVRPRGLFGRAFYQ